MLRLLIPALCLAVAACGGVEARREAARTFADKNGLDRVMVDTTTFRLTTRGHVREPGAPLRVYIEGDGHAWLNRHTPSPNPTPANPVGLYMAGAEPRPNVAYIARPCQYTPLARDDRCRTAYWTARRMGPAVVRAIDGAIDRWKGRAGAGRITLHGYSGGGGIAAILAARRDDVAAVRTVAANLDTRRFTRHHDVTPMHGSLNPADTAAKASRVPQLHFVGGADTIIPPLIAESYRRRAGRSACVRIVTVPGMDHHGAWAERWPRLLRRPLPDCP